MRYRLIWPAALVMAAGFTRVAMASPETSAAPEAPKLTAAERTLTIEGILKALNETYVFPETAKKMETSLRERARKGEYDAVTDPLAFSKKLTEDLQAVSHDKHLRVRYSEETLRESDQPEQPSAEEMEKFRKMVAANNGGFVRVERLDGNIGYLRLDGFMPPDLAGDKATAAMNFLADTDALIVDLRHNGGGDPAMIALISSYLFGAEPVHLNDLYWRPTDSTQQFWTLPYVPGRRFGPEKPIYVLTSRRTFSGAEEFSNNMKVLKRATIVGETTGGGAHPGGDVRVGDHFSAFIPTGRAINPITKTNWEGTGVEPDVKVAADDAMDTAQVLALKQLAAQEAIPPLADERKNALARLEQPKPASS